MSNMNRLVLSATLTALTLSPAHAQVTRNAPAAATLITAINNANTTVFVFSPWLKNRDIATALLNAMNTRGVKVTLLTSAVTITDPGSYFLGLRIAGADLRTIVINNRATAQPFILTDNRSLYYTTVPLSADPFSQTTRHITDTALIRRHLTWSQQTTSAALAISKGTATYLVAADKDYRETADLRK